MTQSHQLSGMSTDAPATRPDSPEGVSDGDSSDFDELEPATPPLLDEQGRVRLSFSRVDTYRRCPAEFRYHYVDGLPVAPSPHLSFGCSIHAALETFYDRKLPEPPDVDDLLDSLYEVWDSSGFAELSREEQLVWYRHAQQLLRRFHARAVRDYRLPADVEKWFELPVDGALVVGSIDRVDVTDDGELEIVDYKTSKRVRDRNRVRSSLQLALYALACQHLYGRLPVAVTLDFLVPGVRVRVPTDEMDLLGARRQVTEVADGVRAGKFLPTPNRLCGWCDYRSICPAWNGQGPDVLGEAVAELRRLRRSVRRDVASLRRLEAGVAQLRSELAADEHDPAGRQDPDDPDRRTSEEPPAYGPPP